MSILGIVPGSAAGTAWQVGFRQLSESNSAWSLNTSANDPAQRRAALQAAQPGAQPEAQSRAQPGAQPKSVPTPAPAASTDPVQADLAALQAALETGNVQAAQAAFEKLLSDMADTHAHSPVKAGTVSIVG